MYYVQAQSDLDAMVEQARDAVGRGFGTIYFKVAIEEERDVELVRRVREAVGRGPKIRVDANEGWSPGTAVRILRRMAPFVIEYIEQPVSMFDLDGMAHVRSASGVAVGANQTSWGQHQILEIVKRNAADVIMTDPHQEGGLLRDEEDPRPLRDGRAAVRQPRVQRDHDHARGAHAGDVHVELDDPRDPGPPGFPRRRLRDRAARLRGWNARGLGGARARARGRPRQARALPGEFEQEGMASIYPTSTDAPVISVPAF